MVVQSSLLRTMAQLAFRGTSIRRKLPRDFGRTPIYVSPESQLKYLRPGQAAFDPDLLQAARLLVVPGSTIWDLGANVGVFTFAAAARSGTGRVLAVEPDPFLSNLLLRSAQANPELRVDVLAGAIGSSKGAAVLQIASNGRASNALKQFGGRSQFGDVKAEVIVPLLTLDDLLEVTEPPDLLKIDVEGAEIAVLEGGARVLSQHRPLIYIEIGEENAGAAGRILLDQDYALYAIRDGSTELQAIASPVFNTVAVPRERSVNGGDV